MFYNSTGEAVPHLPPLTARPWFTSLSDKAGLYRYKAALRLLVKRMRNATRIFKIRIAKQAVIFPRICIDQDG